MKSLILLLALVPALAADRALTVTTIGGAAVQPFAGERPALLYFVTNDCPISNFYSREMNRICTEFAGQVQCYLIYVDPDLTREKIERHLKDYGHGDYPAILDAKHELVKAVGATVTPEAAIAVRGEVVYLGRIDNAYATWGKQRRVITERDLRDALAAVLAGRVPAAARTKATGCFIPPLDLKK